MRSITNSSRWSESFSAFGPPGTSTRWGCLHRKSNEHRTGPFDRTSYRQRNTIEQLINRYKQFCRIATRYEKRAANYQAMWLIATIVLWLGFANTL